MNKLFIIFFCLGSECLFSQNLNLLDKDFKPLFNFLVLVNEVEEIDSLSVVIYNTKITNDSENFGFFQFGINGSHHVPYMYFKEGNKEIEFIKSYSFDDINWELTKLYLKHNSFFSNETKINYTIAIMTFLGNRELAIKNKGFTSTNKSE